MVTYNNIKCHSGLEITNKNYVSTRNVTKKITFPPQFQHFRPQEISFLALIEVKTGTFPPENLSPTLTFPGKAVTLSPEFKPYTLFIGFNNKHSNKVCNTQNNSGHFFLFYSFFFIVFCLLYFFIVFGEKLVHP